MQNLSGFQNAFLDFHKKGEDADFLKNDFEIYVSGRLVFYDESAETVVIILSIGYDVVIELQRQYRIGGAVGGRGMPIGGVFRIGVKTDIGNQIPIG